MSEWILPHVPPKAFEAQRPVHRNLKPEFKVVDPLIDACFPVVRCLTGFLSHGLPSFDNLAGEAYFA